MTTRQRTIMMVLVAAFLLTGCDAGNEEVVYPPDRPYTASMSVETYEGMPVQDEFAIYDDGSSPLAYEVLSAPWGGYLQLYEGSTSFTYWPSPGFIGTDHVSYRAFNYTGSSNVSTVTFVVWPLPRAPN